MAFLPMIEDVVAEFRHLFEGEHIVVNLGLLQADHIWLMLFNDSFKLMGGGRAGR
ncbi:Uncharacterised protein [Enterobacter asburiae]|uniref:Uncharacterized protein n=1 Tax=Enterobacter asburiae TaxID=61645 RepID=A0A376F8I6_ENTAS|nr:Uncharacterised protein [Enterobacter asburiae]